jgi:hypothetical protein
VVQDLLTNIVEEVLIIYGRDFMRVINRPITLMKSEFFGLMILTFQRYLVVLHLHHALLATLIVIKRANPHYNLDIVSHKPPISE